MKSKFQKIDTRGMEPEEWLRKRGTGIGGSDAPTIMNHNPFQSALELFHQKIGVIGSMEDNWATYAGRFGEDIILKKYYPYWSFEDPGNEFKFMANQKAKKVIRKTRRVNAIIKNPDFPIFNINIDSIINKFDYSPFYCPGFDYQKYSNEEGLLECKWLLGYVVRQYESEIPTYYLFQFMLYLGVLEMNYGELFIVVDGRYPRCYPIEFNQQIFDGIIEKCTAFWDKVLEAKIIVDDMRYTDPTVTQYELMQKVQHLEPEPDDSEAWKSYLKDRYNPNLQSPAIDGLENIEYLQKAIDYRKAMDKGRESERIKTELHNFFATEFSHREANTIDFGKDYGSVTWKRDQGKSAPTLRVSPKVLNADGVIV
jgi:putative phage-type endonuclease